MGYFTGHQAFFVASLSLNEKYVKEVDKLNRFSHLLESSQVGDIISKYVNNTSNKGGRPNVNYYNLFMAILYGFTFGNSTLREIENSCLYDIRYITIMGERFPDHSTICSFINKVIVPNESIIFGLIMKEIIKEMKIELEDAFIDGTKFEANANKYKFVFKPITFHKRISNTFFNTLKENGLCLDYHYEELVRSKTVVSSIEELSLNKDRYNEKEYKALFKTLNQILIKVLEYEEKERICGDNRNSYYKTDYDATAMCLKSDYYSGLGSNMHAAYNTQILVIKGLIMSYLVTQSRSDIDDFIPLLDKYYSLYNEYPLNVCADSGYGSLKNYKYLEDHNIGNYVKYFSWKGNVDGTNPDLYRLNSDDTITCLNGNIGYEVEIEGRHKRKANSVFYRIDNCDICPFKDYCMRFIKNKDIYTYKVFEVVKEFIRLKQKAEENLLSPKGIEIRINRSIQVEGDFGIEKQDYGYTRTRRRGINKVSVEMMLTFLGLNIKKLFKFYETGTTSRFWIAPNDLECEKFKKPSAKKLSKKGKKINEKLY